MVNLVERFENQQYKKLMENKRIDDFRPGDTIRVNVRIVEGKNERIQAFEGVCIARSSHGLNASCLVRKISNGEGVERLFPLCSPNIESIEAMRHGKVRRSKLYYMRSRFGKAARIQEKKREDHRTKKSATQKNKSPKNYWFKDDGRWIWRFSFKFD